jgi:hypothetical protein
MIKWVLGARQVARDAMMRVLGRARASTAPREEGSPQGGIDGAECGGVAWPVQPQSHGGASFLARDIHFAVWNEDPQTLTSQALLLRRVQPDRQFPDMPASSDVHADSIPLERNIPASTATDIQKTVFLDQDYMPRNGQRGIVIRGSEVGSEDFMRNYFLPIPSDIRSLCWGDAGSSPPVLFERSTDVADPRLGRARVNESLLVQPGYDKPRQPYNESVGQTGSAPTGIPVSSEAAPASTLSMYNHPRPYPGSTNNHSHISGDGIFGWAHGWAAVNNGLFGRGGPFVPLRATRYRVGAASNHTVDKRVTDWAVGGLDIRAKFSAFEWGDKYEAPLDIMPQPEPTNIQSPNGFPVRVHCMHDEIAADRPSYGTMVGQRRGYYRWHVRMSIAKEPPADEPPLDEPPDDGSSPITGPDRGLILDGTISAGAWDGVGVGDIHRWAQ